MSGPALAGVAPPGPLTGDPQVDRNAVAASAMSNFFMMTFPSVSQLTCKANGQTCGWLRTGKTFAELQKDFGINAPALEA